MTTLSVVRTSVLSVGLLLCPLVAAAQQNVPEPAAPATSFSSAQQNVPPAAQRAEATTEDVVKRFGIGVEGGVGLDPELIMFGAHGTFGPIFTRRIAFRPGIEFGVGEVTTLFGINLDVLYTLPGATGSWTPYVGAGPNFTLSHKSFSATNSDSTTTTTVATDTGTATTTTRNRFNFSDTSFDGGFNFIAGARRKNGVFLEMKATAYGVSNVRLLAGFNF